MVQNIEVDERHMQRILLESEDVAYTICYSNGSRRH